MWKDMGDQPTSSHIFWMETDNGGGAGPHNRSTVDTCLKTKDTYLQELPEGLEMK